MNSGPAPRRQVSGSSFYAGMRVLPRAERETVYAIYAFCRAVDDIADDQARDRADRAAALDRWRCDIDALYIGGDAGAAAFLADHVLRFGLAREDFHAVIEGMAIDVARDMRWPDAAELDRYCDRVACAVGRLCVRVFGIPGATGARLAAALGRALQLTNILRDIDEDAAVGRMYLPREALAAAGISLDSPAGVAADPRLDVAARIVAADAERHFSHAFAILREKPPGYLLAPRLMAAIYAQLLARMMAQGWSPPRRRVRLSRAAMAWTALRAWLGRQ